MQRPNWPGLERRKSRHGKVCWYVRVGHGPRHRLKCEPGGAGFRVEYETALATMLKGEKPVDPKSKGPSKGTLNWLWTQYVNSWAWDKLAPSTREQRENLMKHVLVGGGTIPLEMITKKIIIEGREKRKATPTQANHYLKTLKQLFKWAIEAEHMTVNPVDGVSWIEEAATGGYPEWTDEDEAKFIAKWPLGTRQYVAFMVHACTGLRRGDAVRIGRQHFGKDGKIRITSEKNSAELFIPIHPKLVEAIQACPPIGLSVLETSRGKPWVKESYGNTFHDWTIEAEIIEAGKAKNSHGIRKLAATRVCEAGASIHEMMALFGWKDPAMAEVYAKARDQKKLAEQAAAKTGVIGSLVDLFGTGTGS